MRNEWFCSGPEGRTGPLTLDQLKYALSRHPHASDVYIWHESFPDWVRAGDIGNLDQFDAPPSFIRQRHPEADDMNSQDYAPDYEPAVRRRFSVLGIVIGVLLMLLGCAVAYLAFTGDFTLISETLGFDAEEIDASAGAVFFIAGIVIMWVTRYKVQE
jgi:hypothetical protein